MFKVMKKQNVQPRTSVYDFEESVDVWWIKPHVANRRLAGSLSLRNFEFDYGTQTVKECFSSVQENIRSIDSHLNDTSSRTETTDSTPRESMDTDDKRNSENTIDTSESNPKNTMDTFNSNVETTSSTSSSNFSSLLSLRDFENAFMPLLTYFCAELTSDNTTVKCFVRKLLPRSQEIYSSTYELMFTKTDHSTSLAMFIPLCSDAFDGFLTNKSYLFCFDEPSHSIQLSVHTDFNHHEPPETSRGGSLVASTSWLTETLLHKLLAWSEAASQSESGLRKEQSLALVDVEAYTSKYSELKKRYGPYFVNIWPESTDALKFVYEDIGIATYLLILWEKERKELNIESKQSFVDLGCGNGLLVHVLSSEGHPGRGIDINKRKIWDLYGNKTVLQVTSLMPNQFTVKEDWIIGNHSDELTPWIPIIAARSSSNTHYFVLPCCFFDFNSKFHHVDQKRSHYEGYLEYVRSIGEQCLFKVQQDSLRIPSTKRVCQIGTTQYRSESEYGKIAHVIDKILSSASEHLSQNPDVFTPRSSEVVVKNCSRVKESTKMSIIETITSMLLMTSQESDVGKVKDKLMSNVDRVRQVEERLTSRGVPWSQWNAGGSVHLNDLVQLFEGSTLKELKAQCGGLQTLLKNNRNVFKVVGGVVQLRDYRKAEDLQPSRRSAMNNKNKSAAERLKTKICWFHNSHPHGCLFTSEQCGYAHGTEELRDGV